MSYTALGAGSYHLRAGGPGGYQLDQLGFTDSIRTGQEEENHVRVIASRSVGWLFVNGDFIAELDLSEVVESGSVTVAGAFFTSDEVPGSSTPYSNFTVRTMRRIYGPLDGTIDHNPEDGRIDMHETETSVADSVFEARFFNPYSAQEGDWSNGFLFRTGASNEFHVVGVEESGEWFHRLRTGDVAGTQQLAGEASAHISTTPTGRNHIRIIALGAEGWLFINGTLRGQARPGRPAGGGRRGRRGLVLRGRRPRRQVHQVPGPDYQVYLRGTVIAS